MILFENKIKQKKKFIRTNSLIRSFITFSFESGIAWNLLIIQSSKPSFASLTSVLAYLKWRKDN